MDPKSIETYNCSNDQSKCENVTGWPWFSVTYISIDFLFVSHKQLNESLLLDSLTILGQIGGSAGILF